jgi:hypothetical protein
MTETDRLEGEVASLTTMLHHLQTVPGSWRDWNPDQPCEPQDRQDGAIFACRRALQVAEDKLAVRLQTEVDFKSDFMQGAEQYPTLAGLHDDEAVEVATYLARACARLQSLMA